MLKKLKEKFKRYKCDHLNSSTLNIFNVIDGNNKKIIIKKQCNKCGKIFTEVK